MTRPYPHISAKAFLVILWSHLCLSFVKSSVVKASDPPAQLSPHHAEQNVNHAFGWLPHRFGSFFVAKRLAELFWCPQPKRSQSTLKFTEEGFSVHNNKWFAWMAFQAYFVKSHAQAELEDKQFTDFHPIIENQSGLMGFVTKKDGALIVAIAGSQEAKDWMYNLSFNVANDRTFHLPGKIHRGFLRQFYSAFQKINKIFQSQNISYEEFVSKDTPIYLTGHSMGAAVSALLGFALQQRGYNIKGLYLYAMPRIGNSQFAEEFNSQLGNVTWRLANGDDIVPRIPPSPAAAEAFAKLLPAASKKLVERQLAYYDYRAVGRLVQLLSTNETPSLFADEKPVAVTHFQTFDFDEDEQQDLNFWQTLYSRSQNKQLWSILEENWTLIAEHMPLAYYCAGVRLSH